MMELLIQRRMRRPSENLDVSLEDLTRLLGEWPAGAVPSGPERRASAGPPLLSAVPEDTDNESELSDALSFRATPPSRRGERSADAPPEQEAEVGQTPSGELEDAETGEPEELETSEETAQEPTPPQADDDAPEPTVESRRSSQCSHQETRC